MDDRVAGGRDIMYWADICTLSLSLASKIVCSCHDHFSIAALGRVRSSLVIIVLGPTWPVNPIPPRSIAEIHSIRLGPCSSSGPLGYGFPHVMDSDWMCKESLSIGQTWAFGWSREGLRTNMGSKERNGRHTVTMTSTGMGLTARRSWQTAIKP